MSLIKNELVYEKDFLRDVRRLPIEQQNKLAELLEIFRDDPFNSRLHTKPWKLWKLNLNRCREVMEVEVELPNIRDF